MGRSAKINGLGGWERQERKTNLEGGKKKGLSVHTPLKFLSIGAIKNRRRNFKGRKRGHKGSETLCRQRKMKRGEKYLVFRFIGKKQKKKKKGVRSSNQRFSGSTQRWKGWEEGPGDRRREGCGGVKMNLFLSWVGRGRAWVH